MTALESMLCSRKELSRVRLDGVEGLVGGRGGISGISPIGVPALLTYIRIK